MDLNYMYRQPLWDVQEADSHQIGGFRARRIPLVDLHELVAGKLAALLSRKQSRDLFDCHRILGLEGLRCDRLRIAFVVYGGMNRRDWRTVSIADVDFEERELTRQLRPMLRAPGPSGHAVTPDYARELVEDCKRALSAVPPLADREREFLDLLLDKGEIDAGLLTCDTSLQRRIRNQPLLRWKALNVRRHKGLLPPASEHTSTP